MALRKNYTGIVNKKTFKNEPTKICGRQPLKKLKGMVCPHTLLGSFLNTLSQIYF